MRAKLVRDGFQVPYHRVLPSYDDIWLSQGRVCPMRRSYLFSHLNPSFYGKQLPRGGMLLIEGQSGGGVLNKQMQ